MDEQIKEISTRLAGLRESLQISVEEMAARCGIESETLRRAETGETDLSVAMLQKVAKGCGITLDELLFGQEPHMTTYFLTRYGRGQAVERTKAYKYQSLAGGFKGRLADPFLVTVEPNDDPMTLNRHSGQEFDLVVKGRLLIRVGGKDLILNHGDSLYFNAEQLHGMKALDGKKALFIAVII